MPSDILARLGDQFRALRMASGMRQDRFAKHVGLSPRFLSDLEAGRGNISIARLELVARKLGVTLESFLDPELDRVRPHVEVLKEMVRLRGPDDAMQALHAARALLGHREGTRVALLGIRGAGKSSVGMKLATQLKVPFVELDELVEKDAGMPIASLFELQGEAHYRTLERAALQKLLASERSFVVATGGSIVTDDEEYELLRRTCTTVWLRATPEEHWSRVVAQGDARPMRENPRAMDQLRALWETRRPRYEAAAITIDTSGRPVDAVVGAIVGAITKEK